MSKTYLEIPFDDRLLADMEAKADEEGTDIETIVPILCGIWINS
jgi:hypothetical protein